MAVEEGKVAPAFTLNDAQGSKVSLKDFLGRNVIVYFYPRDDTPGCTKEACGFRDLWGEIQALDTVVLGISPDTGAFGPFGPSPGQVRACQRRIWKYGPPPWALPPPRQVTPVIVLQKPTK